MKFKDKHSVQTFVLMILCAKKISSSPVLKITSVSDSAKSTKGWDKNAYQEIEAGNFSVTPETDFQLSSVTPNTRNTVYHDQTGSFKQDPLDSNVSTTISTNSTTSNDRTDFHSSFNLAIIPAMAAVVFSVAVCLKCCQWFRRYTRGGDGSKEATTYAVIVEDGDQDYGHIDMLSETTSTHYDTVSSFASFLKRGTNDATISSFRSLKSDSDKRSPRKWLLSKLNHSTHTSNQCDLEMSDSSLSVPSNRRSLLKQNVHRPCSTSSDDTETDPLNSSDASILRKNNRFRVSFVTDYTQTSTNSPTGSPRYIRSPGLNGPAKRPLSTIKSDSGGAIEDNKRTLDFPQMVSVGTQTNKSFRYSLKRAQRRHCSESGVDPTQSPPLKSDLTKKKERNDNSALTNTKCRDISIRGFAANRRDGQGLHDSPNTVASDTQTHYPIEPNIVISSENNESCKTDLTDDVFVTEGDTDAFEISTQATCRPNTIVEDETARPPSESATTQTDCEQKVTNIAYNVKIPKSVSDPYGLRLNHCSCNVVEPLKSDSSAVTCVEKTRSNSNSKKYAFKMETGNNDNTTFQTNETKCECIKHICKQCGETLPRIKAQSESPKVRRHNSNRSDTRTFSMTSLESSGYAEGLSSDGSIQG
ncbi:uncharacterized protein LOC128232438 [Mya arenaria]|uniref:uncharacterized protein LOC128232438 n=1 Tax=Mya arenaria TaxID=6604 RepID=UPI0022E852C7|nr:uncharacterized protein LOC128232438 [Mya arenaria]XP_052801943.1 uncharacterized protein LOC128232438 [Mya arenaria]